MIKEFRLPDLGEGLTESEIVSWHVAVGDAVTLNQVIADVETAKAVVELPSPYEGTVAQLHEPAGTVVEVGAPIVSFEVREPAGAVASASAAASGAAATGGGGAGGTAAGGTPEGGAVAPAAGGTAAGIAPVEFPAADAPKRTPNLVGYGAVPEKTGRPARRRWLTGAQPAGPAGAAGPAGDSPAPASSSAPAVSSTPAASPAPAAPPADSDAPPVSDAPPKIRAGGTRGRPKERPKERPRSTPPVRKVARDLGVDLDLVEGSGPDGLIVRADVIRAAEPADVIGAPEPAELQETAVQPGMRTQPGNQNQPPSPGMGPAASKASGPSASSLNAAAGPESREKRVPIAGMQKHMAAAMVSSAFTAPHAAVFLTIDVTASSELLTRLRAQPVFASVKLTPLTLAAKAVCLALARHPSLNSRWDEAAREIVQYRYVNLGIAAATPRGLLVPNIKDAQALGLRDLAEALGALTTTARAGKTAPADLAGGTFSISNVGVFGVDSGIPILNPGEAAILALGAVREQPWAHEGSLALRRVMTLSLSFDHRLVDGEQGARFLSDVGAVLADPAMALALV